MTDPTTVGSTSNRSLLQQRREERVDHVHDIPFNEKTAVECPDCGESTAIGIYGGEIRSYGPCWSWNCDAFHKFRRDRDQEADDDQDGLEDEQPVQTGLQYFGGDA
jgi:hypothetical protein